MRPMRGVTRLVERLRRTSPAVADVWLAGAIFVIGAIDILFFEVNDPSVRPFHVAAAVAVPMFALMALPLAFRRSHLLLTYVLIQAASVVAGQMHLISSYDLGWLLVINVLIYSIG